MQFSFTDCPKGQYLFPALFALALAACSEDAASTDASPSDAGTRDAAVGADAEPGTDASVRRDAGGRDAAPFDGNELRDAAVPGGSGDESIRGTTLEGIAITWDAPVELCSRWQEGRSIDAERAGKALVTVWPAPRPSLGSGHLADATLPEVIVRRSPFADAQWTVETIRSALVDYRVIPQGDATSVAAEIEHDLGPAGVLVETFSVYRSPGDRRAVEMGNGLFEHGFLLRGSALGGDPTILEPCGGPPDLDDAVHVLVLEKNGAHAVLTRYARTVEAFAGSAPVYIAGLDVGIGGAAPITYSGRGSWFSTYAAQHHNWDDTSHFDFSRDLAAWELLFGPAERGGAPIANVTLEAVDLRGVDSWDAPPEADLVWRDFALGASTTETWSVRGRGWVRVDRAAPGMMPTCTGGQVLTFSDWGAHTFQTFICPRAQFPGVEVTEIVPVSFLEDPSVVGERKTSPTESTIDGRAAFRFALGSYAVTFRKGNDADWFFDVRDAANTIVSDALATDLPLWPTVQDETLTFATPSGDVELSIVRRWVAQGVGESSIFAPLLVEARALGRTWHVEAWDRLDYRNTHHNWLDELVAEADDATLHWKTVFIPDRTNTLTITAADGTVLLPETELETK